MVFVGIDDGENLGRLIELRFFCLCIFFMEIKEKCRKSGFRFFINLIIKKCRIDLVFVISSYMKILWLYFFLDLFF